MSGDLVPVSAAWASWEDVPAAEAITAVAFLGRLSLRGCWRTLGGSPSEMSSRTPRL
ncbi:hypothetical protein [Streptomyces misionensis]|uniref:hypothetical protein n=1 Tax=Streptomyces misionensis TaxID=67331 RepID=UPI000ABBE016|nr:hypothetical protein [Streptomyces misionensis]